MRVCIGVGEIVMILGFQTLCLRQRYCINESFVRAKTPSLYIVLILSSSDQTIVLIRLLDDQTIVLTLFERLNHYLDFSIE